MEVVSGRIAMERAEVGGLTLGYRDAGAGEPVVFIHGAFVADMFRPLLTEPSLTDRYRRIAYHRRGYGASGHVPGPTGIAQQAADCRALLTHLGVTRAHVVGHSFGGAIALHFALDAPSVVHSLALLEPALMVGASGGPYRSALVQGGRRYREVGAATVVDEFLQARSPGYRERLDRLLPGAFEQAMADAPTWFENELQAQLAWRFGATHARQISQPVLSILGGESERLWDRFGETHRWILGSMPHAEGFVLPGATHLPQIENPRGLAEGLAAFLARHPLQPGPSGAGR